MKQNHMEEIEQKADNAQVPSHKLNQLHEVENEG